MKNILISAALCCATAYVVVSLFKLVDFATPVTDATNLIADLADPTIILPIAYALSLIVISVVCLRGFARGAWAGAVLGGLIPFVIAAVSMARLIVVHSSSILEDGVAWWGGWFVPVLYSAIPSFAIGAAIGFMLERNKPAQRALASTSNLRASGRNTSVSKARRRTRSGWPSN